MALETPFVSTPVTGIPEIAGENETGVIVPSDDPGALADALGRLADAAAARRALGAAGRRRAEDLFDVRRNVGELLRLFEAHAMSGIPAAIGAS